MLAARTHEAGDDPVVEEVADVSAGEGQALVQLGAASFNPIDQAIAAGRFYRPTPERPYIVGAEAVGRVVEGNGTFPTGARVYSGPPESMAGKAAERFLVGQGEGYELPDGDDDQVAVALGVAGLAGWLSLTARARVREGDRVLVLGATGTAGSVAVQAAKLHGAARVVAAGRDRARLERAKELGADATVHLDEDTTADTYREAFGGAGPTVVFEPLWGAPVKAAVEAAEPGARIVHLGAAAGPETTLASAAIRGKQLDLLGYSNLLQPLEVRADAHRTMLEHVRAGRLHVEVTPYPLARATDAWRALAAGAGEKPVIVPG
jgi:NADPH:quinone reductase